MIPTARTALLAALTLAGGAAIAQTSANPPAEVVLFKNVKVFNGVDDARTDLDVLVVGNKIHKVEADIPETGTWAVKPGTGEATQLSHLQAAITPAVTDSSCRMNPVRRRRSTSRRQSSMPAGVR